jgi:DNA-binding NarL/FixJ family response regulator
MRAFCTVHEGGHVRGRKPGAGTNVEMLPVGNHGSDMSMRYLIVDDNRGFSRELAELLREEGLDVLGCASSGAEALTLVAELEPDVALIDIDLGGESGMELARQLVETRGRSDPKVILISTHDESEYADLIESSPAVGFLAKTNLSATSILEVLTRVN